MNINRHVTRRRFFTVASTLAATAVLPADSLFAEDTPDPIIPIPDDGWRMWPDTEATWKDDALFLPDEVDVASLAVRAPTGGWAVLNEQQGTAVALPASVEQYYWGTLGSRPYTTGEYEYADNDSRSEEHTSELQS